MRELKNERSLTPGPSPAERGEVERMKGPRPPEGGESEGMRDGVKKKEGKRGYDSSK